MASHRATFTMIIIIRDQGSWNPDHGTRIME
jgi:hypothetical protein